MEIGTELKKGEIYYWGGIHPALFVLKGKADQTRTFNENCWASYHENSWNSLHIHNIDEATKEEKELLKNSGKKLIEYKR